MGNSGEQHRATSVAKFALRFVCHQFIGAYGVLAATPIVLGFSSDLFRAFGWNSFPFQRLLNGTPYYPVHIVVAFTMGWLLYRRFRHQSMCWIWVLPFALLTYALIASPSLVPEYLKKSLPTQSSFVHYFGPRCRGCFDQFTDQIFFTVPFYAGVFYSLGSLAARKSSEKSRRAIKAQSLMLLAFGFLLFVGPSVELIQYVLHPGAMRQVLRYIPKRWLWTVLFAYVGFAVLGIYLIRSAIQIWNKPAVPDD